MSASAKVSGHCWPARSALSRRDLLAGISGAAFTRATRSSFGESAAANSIAIVGGGVAGLTCAYRLVSAGLTPNVYEAANRFGGRMVTLRGFHKGMFCELGGEFVDTKHDDLRMLGAELGVGLESLTADGGEDLYYFQGHFRTARDMLDGPNHQGAFVHLARQIADHQKGLLTEAKGWTDEARSLDQISLEDYLDRFGGDTPRWAKDLLKVAYLTEFGLDPKEQSSLNLVDFISAGEGDDFRIFGESDEGHRIAGGSSALIDALFAALQDKTEMKTGHSLIGIRHIPPRVELTFDSNVGRFSKSFDRVVLALPFTRLRTVAGLDAVGLSAGKLDAIQNLGYGSNGKNLCGTMSRPWREGAASFPARSNGTFFSDLPFQQIWETSRAQPGGSGILTNFFAAKQARPSKQEEFDALFDSLKVMSPGIAASLDQTAMTSFFWATYPHTLGSYASAKVGQYTTLLEQAGHPELDGRLLFAGEHTSREFLGYMNGAVQSANVAAASILGKPVP